MVSANAPRPQPPHQSAITSSQTTQQHLCKPPTLTTPRINTHRAGAPLLMCPVDRPTAMSAMKSSAVSPERWLVSTPQPADLASLTACADTQKWPNEAQAIWTWLAVHYARRGVDR